MLAASGERDRALPGAAGPCTRRSPPWRRTPPRGQRFHALTAPEGRQSHLASVERAPAAAQSLYRGRPCSAVCRLGASAIRRGSADVGRRLPWCEHTARLGGGDRELTDAVRIGRRSALRTISRAPQEFGRWWTSRATHASTSAPLLGSPPRRSVITTAIRARLNAASFGARRRPLRWNARARASRSGRRQ